MVTVRQAFLIAVIGLSSAVSLADSNQCEQRQVNQKKIKFKSLEYSVKESEVDFNRVDQAYVKQLNKSITQSVENMKKAKINDSKTMQRYEQLMAALENFNARRDEELESTVTDIYFRFLNQLNANPDFSIDMVNANYQFYKALKKEQVIWQKMAKRKNQIFAKYVQAINDFQNFQKACHLGKYQAQLTSN